MRLLRGLPPYGPPATAFPDSWVGHEGTVVEFETQTGVWVANFRPGLGGLNWVRVHPNRRDAVVIASGDLWVVNPESRSAELVLPAIDGALELQDDSGWVFSRQGIALVRFGATGLIWHTRQLSWDGLDQLKIAGAQVTGLAWSPLDDEWRPFQVDLHTGKSSGGTYSEGDPEQWERLADG